MEVRGVEQNLFPYVGQLVLANVPLEAWIIDLMNIASLIVLARACGSLPQWKNCPIRYDDLSVGIVINGARCLKMFL